MTFYGDSAQLGDLLESLRSELQPTYESISGFRGLLVFEKPDANYVIAINPWEDEEGVPASEPFADQ
jgi:hypothetical protein